MQLWPSLLAAAAQSLRVLSDAAALVALPRFLPGAHMPVISPLPRQVTQHTRYGLAHAIIADARRFQLLPGLFGELRLSLHQPAQGAGAVRHHRDFSCGRRRGLRLGHWRGLRLSGFLDGFDGEAQRRSVGDASFIPTRLMAVILTRPALFASSRLVSCLSPLSPRELRLCFHLQARRAITRGIRLSGSFPDGLDGEVQRRSVGHASLGERSLRSSRPGRSSSSVGDPHPGNGFDLGAVEPKAHALGGHLSSKLGPDELAYVLVRARGRHLHLHELLVVEPHVQLPRHRPFVLRQPEPVQV
mmetsp:Transcript_435/g.2029  ORF Transcript_435/g.2029 Transcript_435/m.2029 type:complete len:301 (-) Transcript_435:387-1289(-)